MIKAEKGTVMANGPAGELLTEYSEITKCIYEALKERTDEDFAKEQMDLAHKTGFMSEKEAIITLAKLLNEALMRKGGRS
jgi:hypothetical protein